MVIAKGRNVKNHKIDGRVFGVTMFGGYSNYVRVPKWQLFKLDSKLSKMMNMVEASAFCATSLTAYYAIDLC